MLSSGVGYSKKQKAPKNSGQSFSNLIEKTVVLR